MSDAIRMNASFATMDGSLSGDIVVEGTTNDLFVVATARAVREQLSPDYDGQPAAVWWTDPDFPEHLLMIVPEGMTLGVAREYFGDEADQYPPTIGVNEGGLGGDSDAANYIIELVRNSFEIAGYVSAALSVQRAAVRAKYGNARRLAKDWNDGDHIAPELRDVVLAKWIWSRRHFDKVFGLGPSRGPLLLRTLGYERHDMDWGEEWHRTVEQAT